MLVFCLRSGRIRSSDWIWHIRSIDPTSIVTADLSVQINPALPGKVLKPPFLPPFLIFSFSFLLASPKVSSNPEAPPPEGNYHTALLLVYITVQWAEGPCSLRSNVDVATVLIVAGDWLEAGGLVGPQTPSLLYKMSLCLASSS